MRNGGRRQTTRTGACGPNEAGFTLIELIVVILIIGVLIAIALPTYLGARERASNRAVQTDLRTALGAAMTYWAELGTYSGFDLANAELAEPSIDWVIPGPPTTSQVAVPLASGGQLLMVGRSRTGGYFCLAQQPGSPVLSRGRGATYAEVDTVLECTGGW